MAGRQRDDPAPHELYPDRVPAVRAAHVGHRERAVLSQGRGETGVNRAETAAQRVAHLCLRAGHHPGDPVAGELAAELTRAGEEFRHLWADHLVKPRDHGVKLLRHPVAGLLTLPCETFTMPAAPEQTIVAYTPEPGSEAAERLALPGSRAAGHAGRHRVR
ncbi:MmyB family transcriptional regulator [Streptomyces sp. NPDC003007]